MVPFSLVWEFLFCSELFTHSSLLICGLPFLFSSGSSVLEECYEFLYLVSTASEDGALTLYESGVMKVLASQISTFSDGEYYYSSLVNFIINLVENFHVWDSFVKHLIETGHV